MPWKAKVRAKYIVTNIKIKKLDKSDDKLNDKKLIEDVIKLTIKITSKKILIKKSQDNNNGIK